MLRNFPACPSTRSASRQSGWPRPDLLRPQRHIASHAPSHAWLSRTAPSVSSPTRSFHSSPGQSKTRQAFTWPLTSCSFASWRHNSSKAGRRVCVARLAFGPLTHPSPAFLPRIKVHFKDSKGNLLKTVEANEGDDILSIAHEYDIDLEGASHSIAVHRAMYPARLSPLRSGACEGSVACSTCHVILNPESYDKLPEPEVRPIHLRAPCKNGPSHAAPPSHPLGRRERHARHGVWAHRHVAARLSGPSHPRAGRYDCDTSCGNTEYVRGWCVVCVVPPKCTSGCGWLIQRVP